MPEGAEIFPNLHGTAPGLAVDGGGCTAILLPGPPREMQPMFEESVAPYLQRFSDKTIVSHSIRLMGIGESAVEDMLKQYMLEHENPTVAPYAKDGECMLRVTAAAPSGEEAEQLLAPVVHELCGMLEKYVYGVDVPDIQTAVVQALVDQNKTIAIAESCTGGMLAKDITDVPGASKIFGYGICTYSNQAKVRLLKVSERTLAEYGAVSEQTAIEMARGVRALAGADIGVSTTGIAGPDGGSDEKPVGLVYVGISAENGERAIRLTLGRGRPDERNVIRIVAAKNALRLVLKTI